MAGWIDSVGNPEGLRAVYRGDPPELRSVPLHEVTLHRDGPSLLITVDLSTFPAHPPAKWVRSGFTTVQVQLRFFAVGELELRGVSTDPMVDIAITGRDPFRVEIVSPELTVTASAGFVDVARFSAYRRGE